MDISYLMQLEVNRSLPLKHQTIRGSPAFKLLFSSSCFFLLSQSTPSGPIISPYSHVIITMVPMKTFESDPSSFTSRRKLTGHSLTVLSFGSSFASSNSFDVSSASFFFKPINSFPCSESSMLNPLLVHQSSRTTYHECMD